MEAFRGGETTSVAPCGHVLHNRCWNQWLDRQVHFVVFSSNILAEVFYLSMEDDIPEHLVL